MTGPKLNEMSFVVGERSGTKATAKYVRTSASKARAVLDLIRGLDVKSADEVLQFTDRHVARDVRKVLASAVANAVNNDEQDAEELYVIACFADEGPTLRRFKPRARGRASRILKRSCHITVIVARMSDERIEIITARQERAGGSGGGRGRPQSSSASRKARVERSRAKTVEDTDETHEESEEVTDVQEAAEVAIDADTPEKGSASDEVDASRVESAADDEGATEKGSASDEADASRVESATDDEGVN
jgi:large subunit ribosomal protein L22